MTDALGFVAYLFSDVLPYTVRELASMALQNPALLALVLFALWSAYVVVDAVVRHVRVLALFGAGYALILVAQRYLATR